MKCYAIQYSDQMRCAPCGLVWDMNDPDPPRGQCDTTDFCTCGGPITRGYRCEACEKPCKPCAGTPGVWPTDGIQPDEPWPRTVSPTTSDLDDASPPTEDSATRPPPYVQAFHGLGDPASPPVCGCCDGERYTESMDACPWCKGRGWEPKPPPPPPPPPARKLSGVYNRPKPRPDSDHEPQTTRAGDDPKPIGPPCLPLSEDVGGYDLAYRRGQLHGAVLAVCLGVGGIVLGRLIGGWFV